MDLVYLGKIVNTHGIKGEVRIISDFKYKEDVFNIGNKLMIDNDELIINSYRKHKNYDMVTFKGINDINEVLKYKGSKVYFNRDEIKVIGYLNEDLIGLEVYDLESTYRGQIIDISHTTYNDLLVIKNQKEYMVPYLEEFVKKIDIDNHKVIINYIKGLEDED